MTNIKDYIPREEDALKMLILFKITQLKQLIKNINENF